MTLINDDKESIEKILQKILIALLIYVCGIHLANYFKHQLTINSNSNILISQMRSITYYSILIFTFIVILVNFGFELSTIITGLIAFLIPATFAFQSFLSNIVASFYITMFNIINIGDNITIGINSGKIIDISIINTTLINQNNQQIIIPNNMFLTVAVTNISK